MYNSQMFKIGNIEIKGKLICAPMAGVTNKVFRKLVKANGANLVYTEMTSNLGLKYNSDKTLELADIDTDEAPVAIQIFGGDIDDYVAAAKYFDKNSNASIIDINMGCPVNKVAVKSQAGSSLLKTPEKIGEIISAIVKEISKPLTIKIRLGWNENEKTHIAVAKIAEKAGAAAIAVHGRTRDQMYSGKADWDAIKEVKQSVKIPVIGNGDIDSPEKAKEMLEYTGVDAVMIGREARKNPWIFKATREYLDTDKYAELIPSLPELINKIHKYYEDMKKIKHEKTAFLETKGISHFWLSNYDHVKKQTNDLIRTTNINDFVAILNSINELEK